MLDFECYERMSKSLLEETVEAIKDEEGIYAKVDESMLYVLRTYLEEHEYAAYWDGFKEMAMNQHLARCRTFLASTYALKGLFRDFEAYVVEQLNNGLKTDE